MRQHDIQSPHERAKSRKAMSVIDCSNVTGSSSIASFLGLGAHCQASFFGSFQLISLTNATHKPPYGDDKPQPLG